METESLNSSRVSEASFEGFEESRQEKIEKKVTEAVNKLVEVEWQVNRLNDGRTCGAEGMAEQMPLNTGAVPKKKGQMERKNRKKNV